MYLSTSLTFEINPSPLSPSLQMLMFIEGESLTSNIHGFKFLSIYTSTPMIWKQSPLLLLISSRVFCLCIQNGYIIVKSFAITSLIDSKSLSVSIPYSSLSYSNTEVRVLFEDSIWLSWSSDSEATKSLLNLFKVKFVRWLSNLCKLSLFGCSYGIVQNLAKASSEMKDSIGAGSEEEFDPKSRTST